MKEDRRVSSLVWGVLSILAGALMTQGGIMEVVVYWPRGETWPVVVGALGAAGSAILLVSGVAFCTKRSFGRRTAVVGAVGMTPVHLFGWILGFVGIPGAILGVVYPALLLLVLRARPNVGAPADAEAGPAHTQPPPSQGHTRQRTALSAA